LGGQARPPWLVDTFAQVVPEAPVLQVVTG
jgi:hypothetical protein